MNYITTIVHSVLLKFQNKSNYIYKHKRQTTLTFLPIISAVADIAPMLILKSYCGDTDNLQ